MRLPFAHPTMLAPMEGVTHPLFRAIVAERPGVGIVCTEFVRITSDPCRPEKLAREVVKAPGVPLSVQVMGRELERMAEAASAVSDAGADVVDINLGCPSKNAARGGVGAAMLKEPAVLRQVLAAMRQCTTRLLSAKIRAGFDDARHIVMLAQTVEAAGADYIVVHPRRRIDFFDGVADWRPIGLVKTALGIPVVGNGDVWYARDALRMQEETGCDGVMLGRPALRNPWLFEQIDCLHRGVTPPRPSGPEVHAWVVDVAERYRVAFGAKTAVGKLKEILSYLLRAVDDGRALRTAALRAASLDEVVDACGALVTLPASRLDLGAEGELGLERSGTAGREPSEQPAHRRRLVS
jgi:tRNA-dihydrouridine synthase B